MKKILLFFYMLAFGSFMVGCSSSGKKVEVEFTLSANNAQVYESEQKQITILSGNGGYKVSISNPAVVYAYIDQNELNIGGLKEGNANVEIYDDAGKFAKVVVAVVKNSAVVSVAGHAPPQACNAGYNSSTFYDDFESISTIDVNTTGAEGFKWYTDMPFSWGWISSSAYTVANSILTLNNNGGPAGWWLSTYSNKAKRGNSFRYGYFEARLRFDPTKGPEAEGFPAWWGFSVSHSNGSNNAKWGEIDFFEAYTGKFKPYNGMYYGTVHETYGDKKNYPNSNNSTKLPADTKFNEWHLYGCLWEPGKIRWYFDNRLLTTVTYSATSSPTPNTTHPVGTFSILDSEYLQLVLGTAKKNWPLEIDWVKVWQ